MASIKVAEEATHGVIESPKEQTFIYSKILNGNSNDLWEVSKHVVALFPDLAPHYCAKAKFVCGQGDPGSIIIFHFGPGISRGGSVKHEIGKVDNKTQTSEYTIFSFSEGDVVNPSFFEAKMKFIPEKNEQTCAIWTLKYKHNEDEVGLLENVKKMAIIMVKTIERAVIEKRIVRHTMVLKAPVDTLWDVLMHEHEVLPKAIPHIIASYNYIEGWGQCGSIRLLRLGHAIPGGNRILERIDINDCVNKKWAYTVLQGDPKYKYLSAVMDFLPGPKEGTTTATWMGVYVPQNNTVPPPDLALHVWKVFESVAKDFPVYCV
ncbi:hypothetical protein KC19_6G009700 [Ceratodon purpureus]|uniref:Bet v I/Major latex protein domain-containing protein n=1 Tax=Ceratodon purpureus TaxID=3225 RepID=A0A8T0HCY0_CERPU|nr:hypothetical protein KC19_6G009700 [Ceratodon purpureus]